MSSPPRDRGVLRTIVGVAPAAGAEVAVAVPGHTEWELISFRVLFTTDATVANRIPSLVVDDGSLVALRNGTAVNHPASTAWSHQWTVEMGVTLTASGVNGVVVPIPRMRLAGGWRLRTITSQLQAADQYGAPVLLVCEYGGPVRVDERADARARARAEARDDDEREEV